MSIRAAQERVKRAVARRRQALKDKNWPKARSALRVARRARTSIKAERARRRSKRPPVKYTFTSAKRWFTRPRITPDLIVLHDAQSPAHSGYGVGSYLSRGSVQADCQLVIDTDGTTYRLVPDGRKAWTQAAYNSRSLSIERVGFAGTDAPIEQDKAVARWIAYWCKHYDIPLRDRRAHPERSGVVSHKSLGKAGGGHVDGDTDFEHTLALAKSL